MFIIICVYIIQTYTCTHSHVPPHTCRIQWAHEIARYNAIKTVLIGHPGIQPNCGSPAKSWPFQRHGSFVRKQGFFRR